MVSSMILIRLRLQGYFCKSGIVIFSWRVIPINELFIQWVGEQWSNSGRLLYRSGNPRSNEKTYQIWKVGYFFYNIIWLKMLICEWMLFLELRKFILIIEFIKAMWGPAIRSDIMNLLLPTPVFFRTLMYFQYLVSFFCYYFSPSTYILDL